MRTLLFLLLLLPNLSAAILDPQMHHLGVAADPEWDEFKNVPVEGPNFDLSFPSEKNAEAWTLLFRQRDVKVPWTVQLNGRVLTNLFVSEDDLVNAFTIPAGALVAGSNKISIRAPKERDDIEVGQFGLEQRPVASVLNDGGFKLTVTEKGKPSPCRVTVVDANGSLFPMTVDAAHAAVRPGVAYLSDGRGTFHLPHGDYTIYVGHGFEYGVSTQRVSLRGAAKRLNVELKREVNTKGYVASDTHVHTFTYSRHGDATAEERAVTLAGEGIELPIATDHNIIMDPVTPARATGTDKYFTPVFGDEVTTSHAHFNIFPVLPGSKPPNQHIDDWPQLMKEMRATPGVKIVILNHPRNVHNRFQPFAATNFNAKTGENLRGPEFSFDAVEVVNSSAMQSDWMLNFHDWMALLNYGYRVAGLGSSDGHDVSRYIIGQGRSYIACEDSDPAHINIDQACESILQGRVLISMGLLAQIKVNASGSQVSVTVQGPSWTAVDQVQLFANGQVLRTEKFPANYKGGEKKRFAWNIEKPRADTVFVAIASGPPVTAPFWRIPKPYQPTSTTWKPRVIGATNPVWLDADGDGKFTPLRLQTP